MIKQILFLTGWMFGWIASGCQSQGSAAPTALIIKKDSVVGPKPYNTLLHSNTETLLAEPGTKSVLFDKKRERLYAMNLEGMSIAIYDRASRKSLRTLRFEKTKAPGWDYAKKRTIDSWEEKPVEGWLTHDDRMLWVSLHNAGGIVGIRVDSLEKNNLSHTKSKQLTVVDSTGQINRLVAPFFPTGATPKIIISTPNEQNLLVSNWHGRSISVFDLLQEHPYAKATTSIRVPAIPRGMVSDPIRKKTYVAIMGGTSLALLNEQEWKLDTLLPISGSPRHILRDSKGRLFVSYNTQSKLVCLDPYSGKTLFSTETAAQPRTIALSQNERFVFVTGYSSDRLEVYQINEDGFQQVASLPCPGHPVGVDLYENDQTLEAWVCSYQDGMIRVFSFQKN